jgi:hypothetical protein
MTGPLRSNGSKEEPHSSDAKQLITKEELSDKNFQTYPISKVVVGNAVE